MNNSIIVLPSARAIRNRQLRIEGSTLFLPNYMTMGDFISKLCIVKDFKILDEDSRVLLLLEASDFKAFKELKIPRNFFTFTKNSSYIFKFFQELSTELYDIDELSTKDIYGEYEEHISILTELYKRYENLCLEKKVLDRIFLPKLYYFNEEYVKKNQNIEIHVEGHLTNFEIELIEKCCDFTQVNIVFSTSEFNSKMQRRFFDMGIELESGYEYKISFNNKSVIEKKRLVQNKNITCESFSEPILQVAFVKKKIYDFIKKGYEAHNIAVIVPNESFADQLRIFDERSNLNFAMGESFSNSEIYQKLDSMCKFIEQDSKENEARIDRFGDEIYGSFSRIYRKKSSETDIVGFLNEYKNIFTNKIELKIFEEEIYTFKNILPFMKDMSNRSLFMLFLQRLSGRTIDDVRGGKITVMGVLETRAVEFDAVIIVDFNDSDVPKRSDKDMFLNTKIREAAGLPTMSDRENLQKHYYQMLINSSKEAVISHVDSKDSKASRFLKQLNIKEKSIYGEKEYASLLFQKSLRHVKEEKEIILKYDFKNEKLSATKLKIFLTCKRKYYYVYIKNLKEHEIPKDLPKEHEIGRDVHTALQRLYSKKSRFESVEELKKELHKELDSVCKNSELEKYLIDMQKRRMDIFCENEMQRFEKGWCVEFCEKDMQTHFAGMTLGGKIDRIDRKDNEIYVLDYKTGSYPLYNEKNLKEATDFQLEFYYLLAGSLGDVTGCGYYDLKESKIVEEAYLQEKLEVLRSHVNELLDIKEVNFSKCEDTKNCLYCEYKIICGRG